MNIRTKIILITLPISLSIIISLSFIAIYTSRITIMSNTHALYEFKARELEDFIYAQLPQDEELTKSYQKISDSLAESLLSLLSTQTDALSSLPNERIFAFIQDSNALLFSNSYNASLLPIERSEFQHIQTLITTQTEDNTKINFSLAKIGYAYFSYLFNSNKIQDTNIQDKSLNANTKILYSEGWISSAFMINRVLYLGYYLHIPSHNLMVVFAQPVSELFQAMLYILYATLIFCIISYLLHIIILTIYTRKITHPLYMMVRAMEKIITHNEFEEHIPVEFQDELGRATHTFNVMTKELHEVFMQVKQFALSAVLTRKNESIMRNTLEKFVPASIVSEISSHPERIITGEQKEISILFTNIHDFSRILSHANSQQVFENLNDYFSRIVKIIIHHQGQVDKYIGDDIMAFFGTPVSLENSSIHAVKSALQIQKSLATYNDDLKKKGAIPLITGISIHHGMVNIGNVGTEEKMDYTIIGNVVNETSYLNRLTKVYDEHIIFSHAIMEKIKSEIPCRMIDVIQTSSDAPIKYIYTTSPFLSKNIMKAYEIHNVAMQSYLKQHFQESLNLFSTVQNFIPNDTLSKRFVLQCKYYIDHPPGDNWNGVYYQVENNFKN